MGGWPTAAYTFVLFFNRLKRWKIAEFRALNFWEVKFFSLTVCCSLSLFSDQINGQQCQCQVKKRQNPGPVGSGHQDSEYNFKLRSPFCTEQISWSILYVYNCICRDSASKLFLGGLSWDTTEGEKLGLDLESFISCLAAHSTTSIKCRKIGRTLWEVWRAHGGGKLVLVAEYFFVRCQFFSFFKSFLAGRYAR